MAEVIHDPPEGETPAHVTWECDGEACVLILYGRLTPDDAVYARRLSVADGEVYLASTFQEKFVGG